MIANRDALMAEAMALREDGHYLAEIGRRLGIAETTASLWTSEYAQRKLRVKRLGRVPVDRECEGYACHVVIPASAYAGKKFCCAGCRNRAKHVA